MNTQISTFYERRKSILPIDFSDRRRTQRRFNVGAILHERRRLSSQTRLHERETIQIPVRFKSAGIELWGHTQDISLGGLKILNITRIENGTPVVLRFSFGENVCFLNLLGQIVSCQSMQIEGADLYSIRVKISAIRDFDKKMLNTAIEMLKRGNSEEKSILDISIFQGTLSKQASNLSNLNEVIDPLEILNTPKEYGTESEITFQRRKHPRYRVQLKGVLSLLNPDGANIERPIEVTSLSRYGLCFNLNHDIFQQNLTMKLQLILPKNSAAIEVKCLRRIYSHGDTSQWICKILFPREDGRRKIHSFLRTLDRKNIIDRRNRERRTCITIHTPDRRQVQRRKDFGVFNECVSFSSRVPHWKAVYTYYQPCEPLRSGRITVNGRELLNFGSKDYLGLTHHPKVKEAAIKAIELYGTSVTGSRVLNGTLPVYEELEAEIADFLGTEAAVFFTSGYVANIGLFTALLKNGDVVFIDEDAHASLYDGCQSAGVKLISFKHNSVEDLKRKMERIRCLRSLIVVDGVYSVDGDIAPLSKISEIGQIYNVPIMVDDAVGFGILGPTGSGTAEYFGLKGQIELNMGVFSSALAGIGGFVACKKNVRDYILHFSRGILFTTSLPPAAIAGDLAALRVIRTEPEILARLWSHITKFRDGLKNLGYRLGPTNSPLISIYVGNEQIAYKLTNRLADMGIYVNTFRRPAVKRGEAKIRLTVSAGHSEADINQALEVFKTVYPEWELSQEKRLAYEDP